MALKSLEQITLPQHRIIGAFDQDTWVEGQASMAELGEAIGLGKVNSLADEVGAVESVHRLAALGLLTMMDLKIHDIDDTIKRRVRAQTAAGSSMITIHAANTVKALKQAAVGRDEALSAHPELARPWLLGVTVLTSVDDKGEETCTSIFGANRATKVRDFAYAAADAGFDAVVCSPQEAEMLANDSKTAHLKRVLPAIRPLWSLKSPDEQATATTPRIAIEAGGDFLVVGRPIIKAADFSMTGPEAAACIGEEIAAAGRWS